MKALERTKEKETQAIQKKANLVSSWLLERKEEIRERMLLTEKTNTTTNVNNNIIEQEEGEEKKNLTIHIANLLKTSYLLWNRDTVADVVIIKNLEQLSNGKLTVSGDDLRDTTDILKQYKKKKTNNNAKHHKHKNRR